MFRCVRAPTEPRFSTDLATLGYHKTAKGEFINTATGQFFDFFHTDNERVNDVRRGAYQEALRREMAAELKLKHGVTEVFLSGENGANVAFERPEARHVTLLATEVSELVKKRDVIVVVGESSQDCGVWAWRIVQREGGVERGSLVGLVRKLAARGGESIAQLTLENEGEAPAGTEHKEIPGIVVLNPGQLLYSHDMKQSVSRATWQSRPRPTAISEAYRSDSRWNFIPGHEVPDEHIKTVFDQVLPTLISPETRLHILTIGDGSSSLVDYLDQKLLANPSLHLDSGNLTSIALIDPTHDHEKISSEHLKIFLASSAKSWVQSEAAQGTKLQVPEGYLLGPPAIAVVAAARPAVSALGDPNPLFCNEDEEEDDAAKVTSSPTSTTTATATTTTTSRKDSVSGTTHFYNHPPPGRDDDVSPTPVPPNTPAASLPTSPDPTIKPDVQVEGQGQTPAPPLQPKDQADDDIETGHEKNGDTKVGKGEGEDDEDDDEDYPPPTPLPVSCPTYSSGVCDGVTETVFPRVVEDVLEFFAARMEG